MVVLKKQFFDVKLEVLNKIVPIATTKPELLEGRTIKLDLTKVLRGKGAEARFIITKTNNNLEGKLYFFALYPSYVRRIIGHDISIVEDSFSCKTKDVELRFKPFLITRKKVHRAVRAALRNATRLFIEKYAIAKTRDKVFQSLLANILQRSLSLKLKKIYPLAVCELRVVKVEKPLELIKKPS